MHGAKAALPYLRQEGRGALIVISSVESMVSLPLHGAYAASKHAVEGIFDALRRELLAEGVPISITSIKPGTIDTPLFANSRDKLGVKPQGPPPVYDPVVVAECALYAAEHPVRDLYVGGAARMLALGQALAPGLVDAALSRFGIEAQRTDIPEPVGTPGNLFAPTMGYRIDGGDHRSRPFSLYTWLATHPEARALVNAGLAAGALYIARSLFAGPAGPAMGAGDRYGSRLPAARWRRQSGA
ncbi:MAG: SDR family NAD(P)-dependent oxidoreductase [Thermomicrobiales bacterium]|nr:SDR family NAD(P)-dependent oxidoreductase [Thermomicrobiales bacterium]